MKKYLKILLILFGILLINTSFSSTNPYSSYFSSGMNKNLDNFILKLQIIKNDVGEEEFDILLDTLRNKLTKLKENNPNNELVLNLVGYFLYEMGELPNREVVLGDEELVIEEEESIEETNEESLDYALDIKDCKIKGSFLESSFSYGDCDAPDIIVCIGNQKGYVVSSCNVGTNVSGTGVESYGDYFQGGRNKGFQVGDDGNVIGGISSGKISLQSYDENNDTYPFIVKPYNPNVPYAGWVKESVESDDYDFWGYKSIDVSLKQGPCEDGYHVPTQEEWKAVITSQTYSSGTPYAKTENFVEDFKIPMASQISSYDGTSSNHLSGIFGFYWTSSVILRGDPYAGQYVHCDKEDEDEACIVLRGTYYGDYYYGMYQSYYGKYAGTGKTLYFHSGNSSPDIYNYLTMSTSRHTAGLSVRCFKNEYLDDCTFTDNIYKIKDEKRSGCNTIIKNIVNGDGKTNGGNVYKCKGEWEVDVEGSNRISDCNTGWERVVDESCSSLLSFVQVQNEKASGCNTMISSIKNGDGKTNEYFLKCEGEWIIDVSGSNWTSTCNGIQDGGWSIYKDGQWELVK